MPNPAKGWRKEKPGYHQRTVMLAKCGQKCFLSKHKKYPICRKNTCKRSQKGVHAAYSRARQHHNWTVAKRAKQLLKK